ncbi:MAG: PQQ-dependent sugar dehydrogenase, partial [Acidimicrobiia bacterium]
MPRHRYLGLVVVLSVVGWSLSGTAGGQSEGPVGGPRLPPGFEDVAVAAVEAPTAVTFTPDGRLLVATQAGKLYLADPDATGGGLAGAPALDLSGRLCPRLEQGLLGVAVHPDFAATGWVYVYWTHDVDGCVHRVSRFTIGADGVADPASETVLVDRIPSPNGNHNGGDLQFGPDGYLYVGVGDGGCDWDGEGCAGDNDASRDTHVLLGKVLRIGADGEIPPDNPFLGEDSGRCNEDGRTEEGDHCSETYARGLRNPFRLAFDGDAPGTRFFVNDVGQDTWEEIDEGAKGADYGWNEREGPCAKASRTDCGPSPDGMTDPIFAYPHDGRCGAITGGAFVPGSAGWPEDLRGDYLFADYACGTIFRLEPSADDPAAWRSSVFVDGLGDDSPVHLTFGPSPVGRSLYYATYGGGGQVRRLDFVGGADLPPRAALSTSAAYGPAPLQVVFDAGASRGYGPDGAELRYRFDFGDGTPVLESDHPLVEWTYEGDGPRTASVVAVDGAGRASEPATATVHVGEEPPSPSIEAPDRRYAIGDRVELAGSAGDAKDGEIPGERLTWHVLLHHDDHTHPFLGPVSGTELDFGFPPPESLRAAGTSWLEVRLTATDSAGLAATAVAELRPQLVEMTVATEPEGLTVLVDDQPEQAPWTVKSWVGLQVRLAADDQEHDGRRYRFEDWSHDADADHHVE